MHTHKNAFGKILQRRKSNRHTIIINTEVVPSGVPPIGISRIDFIGKNVMFLHLTNERTVLVPLDKFKPIAHETVMNEAKKWLKE